MQFFNCSTHASLTPSLGRLTERSAATDRAFVTHQSYVKINLLAHLETILRRSVGESTDIGRVIVTSLFTFQIRNSPYLKTDQS